jgi:hypothetical protein
MTNSKIPGPLGMHPIGIDTGTLARTRMPQPGVVGADKMALHGDVEQAKRALAMDISQLVLDITGIIDPTPISDGANFLISLARRNWVDAVASAVSIVPYIGDLAKTAKLPRYIRSVRKAIDIARFDLKWASALRQLFAKLKQVLDECSKLAADLLPDAAKRQLKELKDEIDHFLSMKGGTATKPSGSGKNTGRQSSNATKSQSKSDPPKPTGKVDKKAEKEYSPGKDDGPKKTTDPDKGPKTPKKKFENLAHDDVLGTPKLVDLNKIKSEKISKKFNYVVTEEGKLVIGARSRLPGGGHIDLARGKPVQAAGEVQFVNGKVKFLNNKSGHYKPSGESAKNKALEAFELDDATLYKETKFKPTDVKK